MPSTLNVSAIKECVSSRQLTPPYHAHQDAHCLLRYSHVHEFAWYTRSTAIGTTQTAAHGEKATVEKAHAFAGHLCVGGRCAGLIRPLSKEDQAELVCVRGHMYRPYHLAPEKISGWDSR